jgi:hypothetical protein
MATIFVGNVYVERRQIDGADRFFGQCESASVGIHWYGDLRETREEALADARAYLDSVGCVDPTTHGWDACR